MDHKQRTKRHEHKKRQLDMLHGSLWNKLIIFALPLALTGVLQQLFNAADVAVLGQFVGTHAMAAVGNNTPVISLFVTLFLGLSLGANVVIARYLGARCPEQASEAVHTTFMLALLAGILLMILGEITAGIILSHLLMQSCRRQNCICGSICWDCLSSAFIISRQLFSAAGEIRVLRS